MRDLVFVISLLALVPMLIQRYYIAVLFWVWFALVQPHRLVFGFAHGVRFNDMIAFITSLAFIFSKEAKQFPKGALFYITSAFMLHTILSTLFAYDFEHSFNFYYAFILPSVVLIFFILLSITNRTRLIALIWVIVISWGMYAINKGMGAVKAGGSLAEYGLGPPSTLISDRNHFSLALLMIVPLAAFLFRYTSNMMMRIFAGMVAMGSVFTIIAASSRGAFFAMLVVFAYLWLRSRSKIKSGLFVLLLVVLGSLLATEQYKDRIDTAIEEIYLGSDDQFSEQRQRDSSLQGRLSTWWKAYQMALTRPFFGRGPRGVQHHSVSDQFINYKDPLYLLAPDEYFLARAAHSIYFEILGCGGFGGLALFIGVLIVGWLTVSKIHLQTRRRPDLFWARDLATAMQISLLAYASGGALLSLAYFDGYWIIISALIVLNQLVREELGYVEKRYKPSYAQGNDVLGKGLINIANAIPLFREPSKFKNIKLR